jgi:hypothetical protein
MTYPRQAIEACEALSHPFPHPTMPIDHTPDDRITEWLHQADGGAKVNTQHPGPIEMHEPSDTPAAVDVAAFGYLLMLVVGILAALVIVSVAGPLIEHLPELMGATAK